MPKHPLAPRQPPKKNYNKNNKSNGGGGNHTNEISILKFWISEIEENHAREHV